MLLGLILKQHSLSHRRVCLRRRSVRSYPARVAPTSSTTTPTCHVLLLTSPVVAPLRIHLELHLLSVGPGLLPESAGLHTIVEQWGGYTCATQACLRGGL